MRRKLMRQQYIREVRKVRKKFGFKNGMMCKTVLPKQEAIDFYKSPDGWMSWMFFDEKTSIPYITIAYPALKGQRFARKAIKTIDELYKLHFYKWIPTIMLRDNAKPSSYLGDIPIYTTADYKYENQGGWRVRRITPYGIQTGLKRFNRNRNSWIRNAYKQLRKEGYFSKDAYQKIKVHLQARKSILERKFGSWDTEGVPHLKRNPYRLSISAIKNIVHSKH